MDFFDSNQSHLQRVYDFTELSNTAEIKLSLLSVMAETLSTMVDYIKKLREQPMSRLIC